MSDKQLSSSLGTRPLKASYTSDESRSQSLVHGQRKDSLVCTQCLHMVVDSLIISGSFKFTIGRNFGSKVACMLRRELDAPRAVHIKLSFLLAIQKAW